MKDHVRRSFASVSAVALTAVLAHIVEANPPVWGTSYQSYLGKSTLTLPVQYHDFAAAGQPGGHADFPKVATLGAARYLDIAGTTLDASGDPAFSSTGHKVVSQWKDATGRNIMDPESYISSMPGDVAGSKDMTAGGAVTSAATFGQWFKDVPGVNTTYNKSMAFTKQPSGNYLFDGTLDGFKGATPDYSYTSELSYYFTYEQGKDWFIDLNTGAEAWVYIDGKLVLDGGGAGGQVSFTLANGKVTVNEPFAASLTVVGAAITTSAGAPMPVTIQAKVGSTAVDPFIAGGFIKPATGGNVNDNKNPRTAILTANSAANTSISVAASSWMKLSSSSSGLLDSHWSKFLTVDSGTNSPNTKLLRNGDAVPNITPFQNQATIASFLQPYLNATTKKVTLGQNQAIYLFELGTTDLTSPLADFQDLVVMLTFAKDVASLPPTGTNVGLPSATTGVAPALSQRISLDRLNWLQDMSTHRVQIFYANRSGSATNFRMETNIRTMNIANRYSIAQND